MRHRVRKGKLGLKTQHRLSLLKNLATELFRHGRIITTNLFEFIAPSFIDRPGGYTRVIKLSYRRGDSAPLSAIELVGLDVPFKEVESKVNEESQPNTPDES